MTETTCAWLYSISRMLICHKKYVTNCVSESVGPFVKFQCCILAALMCAGLVLAVNWLNDYIAWCSVAGDDGINELGIATLHSWPVLFHATHSINVRLSHDRRRAKRVDGIKGVCFSSRPVCIGERICIRITEASSQRNGALRFGFTTDDPCTIDESDLPRWLFNFILSVFTARC